MSKEIAINIQFEGNEQTQQEIFKLPPQTDWPDLEAMLKAQFDCDAIQVLYIDTDGDYITIGSSEELREAFKVASQCHDTLVLRVRDMSQETAVWSIDDRPRPAPNTQTNTQTEIKPTGTIEAAPEPQITRTDETTCDEAQNPLIDVITEVKGHELPKEEYIDISGSPNENFPDTYIENEIAKNLEKVVIGAKIDCATGETVTLIQETINEKQEDGETYQNLDDSRDKETGTEQPKVSVDEQVKKKLKKEKRKMYEEEVRIGQKLKEMHRRTKSAERSVKPKRNVYDSESGEASHDDRPMPYAVFVKFMQQLKTELRHEIVKDVTKKTVKQVLKGLDGAVIHSVQGTSGVPGTCGVPIIPPTLEDSATETKDPESSHPLYYHEGIVCDFCERAIVGVRYKCCNCANYDLCDECEAIHGVHDSDHVFLKLRKPIRLGKRTVILKNSLYSKNPASGTGSPDPKKEVTPDVPQPFEEFIKTKMERMQEKTARKQEKLKKREEKIVEKQKRKEEKLKRRLECHRDHPVKRERLELPPPFKPVNKEYDASFVCDVTVPDGTCVQPGTKLQKTWKMKNTGTQPWTSNTKLRLVYGSIPTPSNNVDVPTIAPNEECDVTVELQAPDQPGKYQSHWKMFDSDSQFGHRVWCEIQVDPKEVLEPICEDSLRRIVQSSNETTPLINEQLEERPDETSANRDDVKECKENVEEVVPARGTISEEDSLPLDQSATNGDQELQEESSQQLSESLVQGGDKQLEKDLSSAVAQLQLDSQSESGETGQDLMSFEMVDYTQRLTPKFSQTATPTNTPLDISPPKSPVPEVDEKALSSSSSVELVNADHDEETHQMNPFVEEFMSKFQVPKPDDDIESISTISDDISSLSEDEDFLIVPLPACFDFTKPITRSSNVNNASDDDNDDVDDNHNNMPSAYERTQSENRSVDEIFTTSNNLTTPPLNPTLSPDQDDVVTIPANEGEASGNEATASEPAVTMTTKSTETPAQASEVPVTKTTENVDTRAPGIGAEGEVDDTTENVEQQENDYMWEVTEAKEPLSYDNYSQDAAEHAGLPDNVVVERADDKGATGHDHRGAEHSRGEFVNQIMSTAVNAANKAAANAYTTCKEVFYTWQARTYQPGGGKWKPTDNKYAPPQSTWEPKGEKWTPKEETFVPPKSEWTPPKDTWKPPSQDVPKPASKSPEGKLFEMGFCNRELNKQLLEKHNNDVEQVVQELLADNDWMHRRH